ncbi:MAG: carboxypeptidase regulatory-like domain-containing protein [Acidobacteria bacterium]|nr:carboxypeptidase regulatory-like domain-containing protein [Acidobacteriota bacterium]
MLPRRRAVAFLLSLGLAVQVAYSAPPAPADGGQVQSESVPAILRIRVLEGEGSIHTVGTRSSQPIVISLTDESGRPVEGVSVSVRLPEEGPTGQFGNGMKTEVAMTGADGRAAIRGIQWSRAAGPVQVRITANKGQARAGILSTQYLTEPVSAAQRRQADPAKGPSRIDRPSTSKWILLAALIGGAAAGGVAAAAKGGHSASTTAPPSLSQPTISIGNPSIAVGTP